MPVSHADDADNGMRQGSGGVNATELAGTPVLSKARLLGLFCTLAGDIFRNAVTGTSYAKQRSPNRAEDAA